MASKLPLVGAQLHLGGVSDFDRDSNKALKKTNVLSRAFGGMGTAGIHGGSLVTGAMVGMMGPIGIVAKGVLGLGKKFIGMAASGGSLRGIQMVFDNLTSSYGINADILERLRTSTKGAVTDFELMKQTNKALVGAGQEFGKMFGEKLPLLMAVSREAAKAQGQSVEFMFDSIVTGIKRSSPMILDNLGFQFSLTEANEKYAASIGKTTKELSKEEKQIALLNAVTASSEQLIEATGGSLDTASKRALSWGTEVKNLRDRMAVELEPVLMSVMALIGKPGAGAASLTGSILGATKALVGKIVPAIELFGTTIESFKAGPLALLQKGMETIGKTGFEDIWEGFSSIFTGAKLPSFRFLGIQLKTALRPVLGNTMAESVSSGVVKGLDAIGQAFFTLKPIAEGVANVVDIVFWTLGAFASLSPGDFPWEDIFPPSLSDTMYDISAAFDSIYDAINVASGKVSSIDFGALFGGASSAVSGAAGGIDIGGMMASRVKALKPVIGLIGNMFREVATIVGKVDFAGVFDALVPAIKRVFPVWLKFNSLFSPMALLFEGVKKAGPDAFTAIWEAFLPVMENMALLLGNISSLVLDVFLAVWPSVEEVITVVFEAVTDVIAIFITSVIPLLLDALNVVLFWFNDNWPAMEEITVGVFTVIAGVISGVISTVVPFFLEQFQSMVDWVNDNWPLIASTITIVMDAILANIQTVISYLEGIWAKHGKKLSKIITLIWANVQNIVTTAIAVMQNVLKAIMLAIHGDWDGAWLAIQDALAVAWEGIQTAINIAVEFIKTLLSLAWVAIESAASIAWGGIETLLGNLWDSIVSAGTAIWDAFAISMELIWDTIKITAEDIWEEIKKSMQGIWDDITGTAEDIWDGINKSLEDGIGEVATIITNASSLITGAWDGIWGGMTGVVKNVWNEVIDLLVAGVNSAISVLNKMIEAANMIPRVNIPSIPSIDPSQFHLAKGGILNKPVFVAGESGAEVVAPLRDLLGMMNTTIQESLRTMREDVDLYGVGSTQIINNTTHEGNEFNLETQTVMQQGQLEAEFVQMQMSNV